METFVVRLWTPCDSTGEEARGLTPALCGFVEHVTSGGRSAFIGVDELIAFLESSLDQRREQDAG